MKIINNNNNNNGNGNTRIIITTFGINIRSMYI